jgi:regulator of protease activity HflC (stomatin/prohibitin superfamily)
MRSFIPFIGVAALVFVVIIVFTSYHQVDADKLCVGTRFGDVVGEYDGGVYIVPLTEFNCYTSRQAIYEVANNPRTDDPESASFGGSTVTAQTSDGQSITVNYTIIYQLQTDRIQEIFLNLGTNISQVNDKVVERLSRSTVRNIMPTYTADELYTGERADCAGLTPEEQEELDCSPVTRATIEDVIQTELSSKFAEQNVTLVDFSLRGFGFDEDYLTAIERKQISVQDVETARNNARAREIETDAEVYNIEQISQAISENPVYLQLEFFREVQFVVVPEAQVQYLMPFEDFKEDQSAEDQSELTTPEFGE